MDVNDKLNYFSVYFILENKANLLVVRELLQRIRKVHEIHFVPVLS